MNGRAEITVPVLNEEDRLEGGISEAVDFLQSNDLPHWSLVIADNGSTDRTPEIAQRLTQRFPRRVRYLRVDQRGVGAAVRASWLGTDAQIVGYMDVDLATALRHLLQVDELMEDPEVLVVNGSRLLPDSIVRGRTVRREITSRGLNVLMRSVLDVGFTDAMCGFKFVRRNLAEKLLEQIPEIPDWFVTAEMLVKAEWEGVRVFEIPVEWQDDSDSKADILRLTKQNLGHILRLRRELSEARS